MAFKQSDRIGVRLSEYVGRGDWRLAFLDRDQVEKVTPADCARVAAAYLKPSNRTIGLFIPEQDPRARHRS
jgi:zinc protease